jgi:hypothetical protein
MAKVSGECNDKRKKENVKRRQRHSPKLPRLNKPLNRTTAEKDAGKQLSK